MAEAVDMVVGSATMGGAAVGAGASWLLARLPDVTVADMAAPVAVDVTDTDPPETKRR